MNKELEAFVRLEQNSKRYKGRKQDLDIVFAALKEKENIEKTINELFSDNGKVITTIEIKKKLKALSTIKEVLPIEEEDFFYDKETVTYFFIGRKVSKEQFDFLKEVLL